MTEQPSGTIAQNTDTPAAQSAQQPATDGAHSGSSNGATLTQEEVNKLVGKARTEGKATAVTDLLKTLGVASSDDLKALIEEARTLKQSQLTDAEKLQAERDQIKKERDEALAERDRIQSERRNDKIAASLQGEAIKLKANDVETVLMYAREKHKAALEALMSEDGQINPTALTALLEKIKAEKPMYFIAAVPGAGSPSNSGGRVPQGDAEAMKRFSANNQRAIRGR